MLGVSILPPFLLKKKSNLILELFHDHNSLLLLQYIDSDLWIFSCIFITHIKHRLNMILILRSFCRFLTPEHNFVETVTKGVLVVFHTN